MEKNTFVFHNQYIKMNTASLSFFLSLDKSQSNELIIHGVQVPKRFPHAQTFYLNRMNALFFEIAFRQNEQEKEKVLAASVDYASSLVMNRWGLNHIWKIIWNNKILYEYCIQNDQTKHHPNCDLEQWKNVLPSPVKNNNIVCYSCGASVDIQWRKGISQKDFEEFKRLKLNISTSRNLWTLVFDSNNEKSFGYNFFIQWIPEEVLQDIFDLLFP
jgi:hypothetical protein